MSSSPNFMHKSTPANTSSSDGVGVRVLVVVPTFPAPSNTWIFSQLAGLIERGVATQILALTRHHASPHPLVKQYKLAARALYAPALPQSKWVRAAKAAALWTGSIPRHPRLLQFVKPSSLRQRLGLLVAPYAGVSLRRVQSYDLIHCHFGDMGAAMARLKQAGLFDAPLLVTLHGSDVNRLPSRYGRDLYRPVVPYVDHFTVGSQFMAEQFAELGGPPQCITRLPMGIDLDRFDFRERHSSDSGPVRLLTVGNVVGFKGHRYLLLGIAKLPPRFRERLEWDVVGDGPLRQSLEKSARELGIVDKVRFHGSQSADKVREFYWRAHLFGLTGIQCADGSVEGQGVVFAEAQACGLPILASKLGPMPETVHPAAGVLVTPGDPAAIARGLTTLIEHPEKWPAMGRAGRAHVEANYNAATLNDQLVALYRRMLQR